MKTRHQHQIQTQLTVLLPNIDLTKSILLLRSWYPPSGENCPYKRSTADQMRIKFRPTYPNVWPILYGLIRGVISGLVFKGHQYVRPYHVCKLGGDLELTFKQI